MTPKIHTLSPTPYLALFSYFKFILYLGNILGRTMLQHLFWLKCQVLELNSDKCIPLSQGRLKGYACLSINLLNHQKAVSVSFLEERGGFLCGYKGPYFVFLALFVEASPLCSELRGAPMECLRSRQTVSSCWVLRGKPSAIWPTEAIQSGRGQRGETTHKTSNLGKA